LESEGGCCPQSNSFVISNPNRFRRESSITSPGSSHRRLNLVLLAVANQQCSHVCFRVQMLSMPQSLCNHSLPKEKKTQCSKLKQATRHARVIQHEPMIPCLVESLHSCVSSRPNTERNFSNCSDTVELGKVAISKPQLLAGGEEDSDSANSSSSSEILMSERFPKSLHLIRLRYDPEPAK
jgi:hypothetical protein